MGSISFVRCPEVGGEYPLTHCLRCARFPCGKITSEHIDELWASDSVVKEVTFTYRRLRVYVFVHEDGTLTYAPDGFDRDNPQVEMLKGVPMVLEIGKELVPQVKLVPKPKEQAPEPQKKKTRKG